jgi:hypothetical protein
MKKVNAPKSKALAKPLAKPAAKPAVKAAKATAKPAAKVAKPKMAAKPVAKPAPKAAKTVKAVKPAAKIAKPVAKASVKVAKTAVGAVVVTKAVAKVATKPPAPAKSPVPVVLKPAKVVKAPAAAENPIVEKLVKVAKAPKVVEPKIEVRSVPEEPDTAEDVVLTDADGNRFCRTKDCDRLAEVDNYCRYHYILLWKNIQIRRNILQEGKLGRYVEELTARYPDKFLEILKKDLRSEKDFLAAIQELEIDESAVEAEFDDEEAQSDLFEIQRVSDSGNAGDRSDSDDRF